MSNAKRRLLLSPTGTNSVEPTTAAWLRMVIAFGKAMVHASSSDVTSFPPRPTFAGSSRRVLFVSKPNVWSVRSPKVA
jgi:hypothetical protein